MNEHNMDIKDTLECNFLIKETS